MDRQYHEVANIFPLMQGDEFEELKSDIKANGLLEPIWLHYDGSIIDGRNRYRACIETEVEPKFRTWNGEGSLVSFVVSMNLHRRHMNSGQRAAASLEALPMLEAEAKERQAIGHFNSPQYGEKPVPELIPELERGDARDKAAEVFHTNARYVSDAKKLREVEPEMFEAVKAGEVTLPQAMKNIHVANNSGNNEWYTPPEYTAAAKVVMGGIDLDPASSHKANEFVGADKYYTLEDDGLVQEWGGRVWMNPPYSQPEIAEFCDKFLASPEINEACVLVNNATDTRWMQKMLKHATAVCFVRGRISYLDKSGKPKNKPLQGQAILYYGNNTDGFSSAFSEFGVTFYATR